MKRVLTFLAIMLLPLSVMAMTPVTDSDLADVTGQAGVNINANLTMDISIGTMAWGDSDGITGVYNNWETIANGGYVGVTGFDLDDLKIRARVEHTDSWNSYSTLMLKPITIDVATGTKCDAGGYDPVTGAAIAGDATFVRMGLGALQIGINAMDFNVALGERAGLATSDDLGAAGLNQVMGVVSLGAMEVYINPWSYVDIYAHYGCGVSMDMNVILDRISLGYASWGDTDGLLTGGTTAKADPVTGPDDLQVWMAPASYAAGAVSAGYIGLRDFNLGDLTTPAIVIDGTVAIDVTTSAVGTYATLPGLTEFLLTTYGVNSADEAAVVQMIADDLALGYLTGSWIEYYLIHQADRYAEAFANGIVKPVSIVHISFPELFTMDMAKITANVSLANNAALVNDVPYVPGSSAISGDLGDIYIEKMVMGIQAGSWVDIWAH